MSVPKWVIKAKDKIRRAFLWKGRKEINGGSCLVAWEKVARHIDLGGLGIPNLHVWSWALQMRCLWFQKTIPSKPWVGLEIPEHFNSKNLFANALLSQVGNGSNTLFWLDHWLHGKSLVDLAPDVVACVPNSLVLKRSMQSALLTTTGSMIFVVLCPWLVLCCTYFSGMLWMWLLIPKNRITFLESGS